MAFNREGRSEKRFTVHTSGKTEACSYDSQRLLRAKLIEERGSCQRNVPNPIYYVGHTSAKITHAQKMAACKKGTKIHQM